MNLAELRKAIEKHFSIGEIRTLCFDLSVEFENLDATTRAGLSRALVEQCEREHRLEELISLCRQARPQVSWPTLESVSVFESPFKGLQYYDARDAELLFGRDLQVGFAYPPNKSGFYLWNDPREEALREATYHCLKKLLSYGL